MKRMMNKYVGIALGALLGMGTLSSCDKDDDNLVAPEGVMQAFAAQYPNMTPRWDFEWGNYEADFFYSGTHAEWNITMNNVDADAYYTQGAQWIRTEFDVTPYYYRADDQTVIRTVVRDAITAQAQGRKVDEVKIMDMPQPETDYYRIEIDSEPEDVYVNINFDGTLR